MFGSGTKHKRVHAGTTCIPLGWSLNYLHQPCLRNGNGISLKLLLKSKSREVLVGCNAYQMGGGDDNRALETVLKLYSAIKNKSFTQLSDVIGEECLCVCTFASSFQPFHGKENGARIMFLLEKVSASVCVTFTRGKWNADMFLEPILHIEPFRLQTVTFLMNAMNNICSRAVFKGKAKEVMKFLFYLVIMAAIFLFADRLFKVVCRSGSRNYWPR